MKLFTNMRISHKISALMIGLVTGFIAIGVTYYVQVLTENRLREQQTEALALEGAVTDIRLQQMRMHAAAIQLLRYPTERATRGYEDATSQLDERIAAAESASQGLATNEWSQLKTLATQYHTAFANAQSTIASGADETALEASLEVLIDNGEQMAQMLAGLTTQASARAAAIATESAKKSKALQAVVVAIIFTVAILTAVGIYLIYHSIIFPMAHMQSVIRRINRGKMTARVRLLGKDELGDLGTAFNTLFDERIQQLDDQSRENDRLNNSIISLIRALGAIADKDLTVKVPVSEDITGTVSDAVNLLTTETATTLHQVKDISNEVNRVAQQLQDQAQSVSQIAEGERRQVMATSKSLEILASAMNDIAERSEQANSLATRAIDNTRLARSSVVETVNGIRTIRETISETEKRMKRLGDRSQEISGIVNLINTIAERTHILALNASMHAASAGEAGKGFAVVADEVQRLAESARSSTDEIAAMVNNIRVETSDTVTIMNTLIAQVAEGSRTAEKAGSQMGETELATQNLVENVKVIAQQAKQQAGVADQVRDRATVIRKFTEKTAQELQKQKVATDGLRECAATLVERVSVFTLPEGALPVPDTAPLQSVG